MNANKGGHIAVHLTFEEDDKLLVACTRTITGDPEISDLGREIRRRDTLDGGVTLLQLAIAFRGAVGFQFLVRCHLNKYNSYCRMTKPDKNAPGPKPGGESTLASVATGEINLFSRRSDPYLFRPFCLCPRVQRPRSRLCRRSLQVLR